ncbi:MAG TPA: hypothetical protein VIE43_03900 [Thermoanaerobaculia bacterium]|nr:hypothetical protein [Thermoanaerobaculia bacterium]
MQGTIAQVIAVVTHGNAFLSGEPGFDAAAFYPTNSTFKFCEFVRFVERHRQAGGWIDSDYATDPVQWFERLRQSGTSGLRLIHVPGSGEGQKSDRWRVGFIGGGGRWLIDAATPAGSEIWEAQWEVGDPDRADHRIWRVTYGRLATGQLTRDEGMFVAELKWKLQLNLTEIAEFARTRGFEPFDKAFESGLSHLTSQSPLSDVYHQDFAPIGSLPLPAAQLLGTAQAAWVFGGMGSWNDLGFEGDDQAQYDRLSDELYALLVQAAVTGANMSVAPRNPLVTGANPNVPPRKPSQAKPWWQFWK